MGRTKKNSKIELWDIGNNHQNGFLNIFRIFAMSLELKFGNGNIKFSRKNKTMDHRRILTKLYTRTKF